MQRIEWYNDKVLFHIGEGRTIFNKGCLIGLYERMEMHFLKWYSSVFIKLIIARAMNSRKCDGSLCPFNRNKSESANGHF